MNKKTFLAVIITALVSATTAFAANSVTIVVHNSDRVQRQELVEVDLKTVLDKLQLADDDAFIVKNGFGQQVAYQITHDGKLLIDAAVRPCGEARYTVCKGIPESMKAYVFGKFYPTRKDDIAWENDRSAYRVYGPTLQRTGERSFGVDVFTKNTPELVIEDRYTLDYDGNILEHAYRVKGQHAKRDETDLRTSFHLDHGNGCDSYSVGPTLGCGAPALMYNGKLVMPYCFKDYDILDNGPLRFTVALTYNKSTVGKDTSVVEHRIINLDKGSSFNKVTVWYEGLSKPCPLASGVVIHSADKESVVYGKNYVHYADPTDTPDKHNFQIYVAALFPNGDVKTQFLPFQEQINGIEGHALGVLKSIAPNEKYTYYFGSAWSKHDVRTQQEWQLRIDEFMSAVALPLKVTVE